MGFDLGDTFRDIGSYVLPAAEIVGGGVLDIYGMPEWGVPLTAAGTQAWGQADANRSNRQAAADAQTHASEEADKNRTFQAQQAESQDAFQTTMSNTAYQRQRADMIASGLNPMALASSGGASSPSGASGSGAQGQGFMSHSDNVVGAGISSAVALKQAMTASDAQGSTATLNTALATKALQDTETSSASAKQMGVNTQAVQSQLAAIAAKAKADAKTSEYDLKASTYDAIMSRANRDSGTAKNLSNTFKMPDFFGKNKRGFGTLKDGTNFNLSTGEIP